MAAKTCSKCGESKPVEMFHKHRTNLDGYRGDCKVCRNQANKEHYKKNKARCLATRKAYYYANHEQQLDYRKGRQQETYEQRRGYRQAYYETNKDDYRRRGRIASNKRRASKIHRTPTWSEEAYIAQVYTQCPEGHHVDHIIPLQGSNVSGLHVLDNLQWLTAEENMRKGNSHDGN